MKMSVSSLKTKKSILSLAAALMVLTAAVLFVVLRHDSAPVSETRFMLDTVCTITLYGQNKNAEEMIDGAFRLCAHYDRMLSATVSGSDIDRINRSHGKPVTVSEETAGLLTRAAKYSRLSGGAFDVTIYPVKKLWDFSGDAGEVPDADALALAAASVDYTRLQIDGNTVTLPEGMGIDLGAIAKGFIADKIADYLKKNKVTSAVIDLGGNIYALGSKPDGGKWRVGIRRPFADDEAEIVEVSDASVVTSGVYQRYFKADGKIYHHILRASDGMPCETGLYSVSIIAENSELCDALSTVCMLLGYEASKDVLAQFDGVSAVFITSDLTVLHDGSH